MDPFFATAIFVLGLAFGSFLNVCIHRLPRRILLQEQAEAAGQALEKLRAEGAPDTDLATRQAEVTRLQGERDGFSVVHPKSACPKCHQPIRPYDNIPVVSWLILGGRCRHCKNPISPRYITVELITGLLFLACFWRFGLTLATLKFCIFSFLIVGLTFIDAQWKLLPDAFTLPGLAIGLLLSVFLRMFDLFTMVIWAAYPGLIADQPWQLMSLAESAFGAFVGAGFFYFVAVVYRHARGREGMGMGDVKLMAMVGAFLGVRLTVLTIFGASVVGSIFGLTTILVVWQRRTTRRMAKCREPRDIARKRAWTSAKLMYSYYGVPFGVFLGPMSLLALFFGNLLMGWYWRGF